jgi:hypothetical protein
MRFYVLCSLHINNHKYLLLSIVSRQSLFTFAIDKTMRTEIFRGTRMFFCLHLSKDFPSYRCVRQHIFIFLSHERMSASHLCACKDFSFASFTKNKFFSFFMNEILTFFHYFSLHDINFQFVTIMLKCSQITDKFCGNYF